LHVLNTSPTEVHWIALAGHRLQVMALDGNPVPTARSVPMVRLAPGERVCAIVEMDNPGIWTCGEVRKHIHAAGMAIAVEYADKNGSPQWQQPTDLVWNYEQFADANSAVAPTETPVMIPLVIESKFRGHSSMEAWTINGRSYPDTSAAPLQLGRLHRLRLINKSMDDHPLHLHRHSFELRRLGMPLGAARATAPSGTRGIIKDVVLIDAQSEAEVDFIADNPGATLFHCHQQSHMDLGFMLRFDYA
jgi:FtsP/CotA-like multicopper oxidase with cupredoxin domain